jgi:type IV pilus assembly protein PilM
MVGVDIGTTEVRAIEVAGVDSSGLAIITRVGLSSVAEGSIVAGRIKNPQGVATALVKALKRANLPSYGFVINLSSPDVAMTTLNLPSSVRRDERTSAIRALGRPLSAALPLEETVLASQLISSSTTNDGIDINTIAVAGALESELEVLKTVCKIAKCKPRAIDFTGVSLIRSLTRSKSTSAEIATVVDVGASKTSISTRVGPHVRSMRVFPGGGIELTRSLLASFSGSFDNAELAKTKITLPTSSSKISTAYSSDDEYKSDSDLTLAALGSSVEVLIDTIAQSIDFDASTHGSYSQGVFLTGGTGLLKGFKDRLQQRVGIPVVIGKPWADLERSKRNIDFFNEGKPDPFLLYRLSNAVGLALWKEPL